MKYSLLLNEEKEIPCFDHCEKEVFYTALTLSDYGYCRVDVLNEQTRIATYIYGKRKQEI